MKMLRTFMLLLVFTLFLTGCWDRYELEERANILALAIDLADGDYQGEVTHRDGDFPRDEKDILYKVTAQVALPGKIKLGPEGGGGQGSEKTAWLLETYGHTIKDAMSNLQQQLAEKLYLGHLQIIVVSDEIAKKDITDISEYLKRNYEVRRTAWMAINKKDAAKVLRTAPPLETVPALYLGDTLDNAVRFGKLPREYLGNFWIDLSDKGIDPVLPGIKVINNDRIMVDGIAYFRGGKMVGLASPIEIGAFMDLKEKASGGYPISVSLGDESVIVIQTQERNSKIKVDVKNGTPSATIHVEIEASIEEAIGVTVNGGKIKEIEKAASNKMEEVSSEFINRLQEQGADVLGLGARIRAKFGTYWDEEVKTDEKWSDIYKDMEIKVAFDYTIRRTGIDWE
ncbi:Ger(x)C family spore germination protein [Bacillus timonensis]|uniref:Ger(X)C family spore germination protein n=1 Tax=Bacillus timonensis TaxID=1033734 RepID=A0A4S3PTC1_9BACI|nr:Ger(x)C family spore germination protein [Bacillus timonensis]THE13001.1 Ger(x)C family spore germination protein [Bacillus timonensis]